MLPAKQRTLFAALLIVGVTGALLGLLRVAWAIKQHEVRVEVEAKDGAFFDGMFAANGHPLVILSNVTATNLTRRSNGFSFVFNNSTNVGTLRIRAYLDGQFQGEASSGDGVCGWFKPAMGQTKVSVLSQD